MVALRHRLPFALALSALLSLSGVATSGRVLAQIDEEEAPTAPLQTGEPSPGAPTLPSPAANAEGRDSRKKGVELNLVNLPIAEAAKIVLGDMQGVDFVIDPRLEGRVTAHTSRPVTKRQALDLFQSALRVSGAALVRTGRVYKIVPVEAATTSGGSVALARPAREENGLGGESVVVPLRFVSAAEMKRVLDPIAAKGGVVRADEGRRAIVLSGSPQEIEALREAIGIFDVDAMRGMSFGLIPVKSSDPASLSQDLRTVFGSEKEGPMNGMIQFIGNKRLNAILVITSQSAYLDRARAWIERLDARAQTSEKQLYTYRVQNRPAKELLAVLTAMFSAEIGTRTGASTSPRQTQSELAATGSAVFGQNGNPPTNPIGGLNSNGTPSTNPFAPGQGDPQQPGVSASGAAQGSGPQVASLGEDSRFRVAADEAKNALIVMASPADYRRILRVIETLDVMPNQVFIEATIAEVSLNDTLHFGVAWYLNRSANNAGFSNSSSTPAGATDILGANPLGANMSSFFPGFSYALRATSAQVTLNALNEITKVNIVSTPSLTVLDNHKAVLQVGDQVPVTSLESATALGNTFTSVAYRDTGVILSITPHISESGRVILDLVQEVSNVKRTSATANNTNPTIQQRKVATQVIVKDGEALMLGGLMQSNQSNVADQIPVLGDIPIIGNAFKDKTDAVDKTELLIMITPHVLRSSAEARAITEDYKRQMLEISSHAIKRPHTPRQTLDRAILDKD